MLTPNLRIFGGRWTPCIAALFTLSAFAADEPVVMKNTGEPIAVPYQCDESELQAAGLLCTEDEPCAIYLELSGVAPLGRKVYLTGNLHATSGTLASILLGSEDGGATWKEPSPRVRAAALGQIQFYDLEHGWTSGETQYPLVRDPFFLVTSDGGMSWRNHPIVEDGGPGSVQKFLFDSAQHGEMIVDAGKSSPSGRYLFYESETSGQSWMIRSTSDQAPKLKHAPPVLEHPDFRIHPVAKGSAYEIQKRNGERGRPWPPSSSNPPPVSSKRPKPKSCRLLGIGQRR